VTVFLDNDALLKLVAWDLLDDALALLGAARTDVQIHSDAGYVTRSKRKKPEYGGKPTFDRLDKVLPSLRVLRDAPDGFAALVNVENVDVGEAILIGHAASTDAAYLTTGDKRCVRALADPRLATFRLRLAGRIVCVEAAIEALILSGDFAGVRRRILPARSCDTAIMAAFGSGMKAERASVLEALRAYLAELPPDLLFRHA